ncbi:MAG TPA: metalloregulator ArsR/SmtB family transcription factor [Spirochaetia bacterium]|nr:metalloregulator ArsR/SmtB family transcription factor [Spirochaetia bacterium]
MRRSTAAAARNGSTAPPPAPRDQPTLADILKALGEGDRLRLFRLFVTTNAEICVCELVDALRMPQYQVSRHLKVLKDADLLSVRRKGTWAYYSAHRAAGSTSSALADLVADSEDDEIFAADAARLSKRFSLRVGDRCVVGFAEAQESTEQECRDGCG